MIKVSVDVGSAGLRLVVLAESIRRALLLVEDRYPGAEASVVFPLDPDEFFVGRPATAAGIEELGIPEKIAV
jgi:hypothetical protein